MLFLNFAFNKFYNIMINILIGLIVFLIIAALVQFVRVGELLSEITGNNPNEVTDNDNKKFLTAVATDSHSLAISKTLLSDEIMFEPIILPNS